jgi:hypothetical protein
MILVGIAAGDRKLVETLIATGINAVGYGGMAVTGSISILLELIIFHYMQNGTGIDKIKIGYLFVMMATG